MMRMKLLCAECLKAHQHDHLVDYHHHDHMCKCRMRGKLSPYSSRSQGSPIKKAAPAAKPTTPEANATGMPAGGGGGTTVT